MYKCKECGLEYQEKPDYCDCGNDEFEIVEENIIQKKESYKENSQPEFSIVSEDAPHVIAAKDLKYINQNVSYNSTSEKAKKTFSECYPGIARFFNSIDPISGAIFLLCIVLSVCVILFAWNVDDKKELIAENNSVAVTQNIPSIDKFWNNAVPAKKQNDAEIKPLQNSVVESPKQNVIQTQQPINKVTKPTTQKVQASNTQKNNQSKTTKTTSTKNTQSKANTQKTSTSQTKTAVQKPNTNAQTKSTTPQKQTNTQNKQILAQEQKTNIQIPQKTEAEILAEQKLQAQKLAAEKQELSNYKTGLRNALGRKIDFTRVVGDGTCTVVFKVNSSGKLIERSFAKQSSNITLNDAVYAAVMSLPTYNPPPSGYKNEILNLNISFYNGNFEITLK